MGVKVGANCLHLAQPVASHSPSSAQALASAISSPSAKKRGGGDRALVCRLDHRSAFLGTSTRKLLRSQSCNNPKCRGQFFKRACSVNLDGYPDEEFVENIRELALRFHPLGDGDEEQNSVSGTEDGELDTCADSREKQGESSSSIESCGINSLQIPNTFPASKPEFVEPPWPKFKPERLDWPGRDEIDQARIVRKANSVDLPLSLRIIKKKRQWEEGFREAGESAYCSVKRAFSSMVFIIRELHSYTLQMRELLFYEDLQDILARVQNEMHASFVWLFQQVFSHTPTLMVYVMILLANFTVFSMGNNTAIAVPPPPSAATEIVTVNENQQPKKFDSSSAMKTFSVSSSAGNTVSVGGQSGGGGGKFRPVKSGTEGDGRFDGSSSTSNYRNTILPSIGNSKPTTSEEAESESVGGVMMSEEELRLWNSMVEEAMRMQAGTRDEALDHDTMQRFVSPVMAAMEADDQSDYLRTDLLYQMSISQEPNNPLLLANYAQFLYLIVHDHDRAEEYFKRAIGMGREEEADAEALSKYATFLWLVRKDISAAEETYLEAIAAEPGNTYHAATYAHFLWNTGGEDTCYPLSSPDNDFNKHV